MWISWIPGVLEHRGSFWIEMGRFIKTIFLMRSLEKFVQTLFRLRMSPYLCLVALNVAYALMKFGTENYDGIEVPEISFHMKIGDKRSKRLLRSSNNCVTTLAHQNVLSDVVKGSLFQAFSSPDQAVDLPTLLCYSIQQRSPKL